MVKKSKELFCSQAGKKSRYCWVEEYNIKRGTFFLLLCMEKKERKENDVKVKSYGGNSIKFVSMFSCMEKYWTKKKMKVEW